MPDFRQVATKTEMVKGLKAFTSFSLNAESAQILAADLNRLDILIRNLGPDVCFLYGSDSSVGFPLFSGETFEDEYSYDPWSAVTSGTLTLRIIEVTAQ